MRLFAKYTLFLAAPLALASSGCMTGAGWLAARNHGNPAEHQMRLSQAAQRYEASGQYQAAYQAYYQLAQQQPNNQVAQQRLQELAQKVNSGAGQNNNAPPTTINADQALRMLAEIQVKHREEMLAKRQKSRNTDEMLAALQSQLDEFKAKQARIDEALKTQDSSTSTVAASTSLAEVPLPVAEVPLPVAELVVTAEPESAPVLPEAAAPPMAPPSVPALVILPTPGKATMLSTPEDSQPSHADNLPAPPTHELADILVTLPSTETTELLPEAPVNWQPTSVSRLCDNVPAELQAAFALLDSQDPEEQIDGLSQLGDLGQEAQPVAVAVRALLSDPIPTVRAHAAEALFLIDNDTWDAADTLASLLSESDESVVQLASYILGQMGSAAKGAVPLLEVTLTSHTGVTSLHAAEALVRISPEHQGAFEALRSALNGDDQDLRWFAAVAMGSVKGANAPAAVEALQLSLHDDEADVRAAAALSLGGLGADATRAIQQLEQVALFDEEGVRDAATTALACLRR